MPINGFINIGSSVQQTLAVPENNLGSMFASVAGDYSFANGTGISQNDLAWSDRRTLAAGATDTFDLNGGGLLDVFGAAVNFVEVTAIVIRNRETVAGARALHFGPAGANPFLWLFVDASDLVVIKPNGAYCQWSDEAQTVTPGSADSIRVINTDGANSVSYDILIVGRSA